MGEKLQFESEAYRVFDAFTPAPDGNKPSYKNLTLHERMMHVNDGNGTGGGCLSSNDGIVRQGAGQVFRGITVGTSEVGHKIALDAEYVSVSMSFYTIPQVQLVHKDTRPDLVHWYNVMEALQLMIKALDSYFTSKGHSVCLRNRIQENFLLDFQSDIPWGKIL